MSAATGGRGWTLLLGCAGAFSALALACAQAPPPRPAEAPAPAAIPAAAPQVKLGGKVNLGTHADPVNFDPHRTPPGTSGSNLQQFAPIYSSVFRWPAKPFGPTEGLLCQLCESWQQPDGTTYVIKLRQGVKWHNIPPVSGRELTSADVKYSFERMGTNQPGYHQADAFDAVTGIETPDNYTVRITLKSPSPTFLVELGDPYKAVVAREVAEAGKDGFIEKGVGTGPFVFKEKTPKSRALFTKNPAYFDQGRPYLDELEVIILPDQQTLFDAFMTEQVHTSGAFVTTEQAQQLANNAKFVVQKFPRDSGPGAIFNLTQKPVDDLRVRRALHLATDRQQMIQTFYQGDAMLYRWVGPAFGELATPQEEVARQPGFRQPKEQDLAEAKQLLAEAGFASGLKLTAMVAKTGDMEKVGVVLQQQYKKVGVDLQLEVIDQAVANSRFVDGNFVFGIQSGRITQEYTHPAGALKRWHTGDSQNESRHSNREFDAKFEKMAVTTDRKELARMVRELEDLLDRAIPGISVYQNFRYTAWNKRVHGPFGEVGYGDSIAWVSDWWLE